MTFYYSDDEQASIAAEDAISQLKISPNRNAKGRIESVLGRIEQEALKNLAELGAEVSESADGSYAISIREKWLGGDTGLAHLRKVTNLSELRFLIFSSRVKKPEIPAITAAGLRHLKRLRGLRTLKLPPCTTDESLVCLKSLSNLTSLEWSSLSGQGQFTGAGLVHIADLKQLERLNLYQLSIDDEQHLRHITGLPNLNRLTTPQSSFSDEGMKYIGQLTGLEYLSIENTFLTDDGLVHLSKLRRLSFLNLSENAVTDAGLHHLKQLEGLRVVNVTDTFVSPDGAAAFRKVRPDVRIDGAVFLAPSREHLVAAGQLTRLGAKVSQTVENLGQGSETNSRFIIEVSVSGRWKGQPQDLALLTKLDPPIDWLWISAPIGDEGAEQLQYLSKVREIQLRDSDVTDDGLRFLTGRLGLKSLVLNGGFSDDAIKYLKRLTSLERISLSNTQISAEGVAELRESLPNSTRVSYRKPRRRE